MHTNFRQLAAPLLIVATLFLSVLSIEYFVSASEEPDTVDIVFTTDTHSYLASYNVVKDGENVDIGGVPRMSTCIKKMKKEHPNMVLVDSGDYPMGTLYQTLYTTEALEYQMLSHLGYDAITFGNHDFDYGTEGMALQFEAAKSKCDYYPDFTICNVDWTKDDAATKRIKDSLDGMNLCEYTIIDRGGLKIGITGVLGYDALACAPTCELTVLDPIVSVRETVRKMKEKENPDIIICISHSGTADKDGKAVSEDEVLAEEVPDIDFIVSGHAHRLIPECIKVGDTYIGSSGCYGEYVGYASLKKNSSGRYDLVTYELVTMDEKVEEDPEILELIKGYDTLVNEEYLAEYGYSTDEVIGHNIYEFATVDDLYFVHDDHNLGQFIADAYRWKALSTDTGNPDEVSGSVAPAGTIRATFPKGDVTVAKVFEIFSLGSGLDGTVGYPLVDIYLTGSELETVCEIDASISDFMPSANLYFSGMDFEFNPHRMLLNKTTWAKVDKGIGTDDYEEIDPDRLYRVVTDLYSLRMLGAVKNISKGLIQLTPKLRDGSPITDEAQCVIHDADGNELKAWIAIADYLKSLDADGDGIGEIPALYDDTDDRKQINDSKNIVELVKNPNKYFWGILAVVIVIVLVIVLFILLIVKIIKKVIYRMHIKK